jgi:hypothetical protein
MFLPGHSRTMSRFATATCLPLSLPYFSNLQITFIDIRMVKADIYHPPMVTLTDLRLQNLHIVTSILRQACCWRLQHIKYSILLNYNWLQVYVTHPQTLLSKLSTLLRDAMDQSIHRRFIRETKLRYWFSAS